MTRMVEGPARMTVGHPVTSILGRTKVTGEGRFPPDYPASEMLHGAVLRSDFPHARLAPLDLSVAQNMPGVAVVLSRLDMGLDDVVRHYGDVIAAVAADTDDAALAAVAALDVEFERLPVLADPQEALATSLGLDPEKPDNLALEITAAHGDVESALSTADVVIERSYHSGRPTHVNLSRRTAVARVDSDGVLEVMTSVDAPFFARRELADVLDRPVDTIRIVLPELATSSFGGRSGISRHCEPIAGHLALRSGGRPVRLMYDPTEEFTAGTTRHPISATIVAGATGDGKLLALDIDLLADHGPYNNFVNRILLSACRDRPLDIYEVEHYRYRGRSALTNNPMAGEMRGIGATQIGYFLGAHMDELARRLDLDPIDFHMRNLAAAARGANDSGGLAECIRLGAEAFAWGADVTRPRTLRGAGVGLGTHTTGLGTFHGPDRAAAAVTLGPEGETEIAVAAPDSGQGSATIMAQIVSEELGVDLGSVVLRPIDTESAPNDPWGSVASRGTYVVGSAVKLAASSVRRSLVAAGALMLGVRPEAVELTPGVLLSGDARISVDEVISRIGPISETEEAVIEGAPPTYGAYFAEVDVDADTGVVVVTRFVAALDVGFAVNPAQCRGQIEGALALGMEFALGAEVIVRDGLPENVSLVDYRVTRASDMPEVEVILVEGAEEGGPYGARGIGTPAMTPVLPAIANAVRDALGFRVDVVPMTPEVIRSAVALAEASGANDLFETDNRSED